MDLSDDEDFYDSDQSDVGDQSLHAMLKKTLYDKDNEYEEYGEQIPGVEEALGSVQEEVIGKLIDNGSQEEVALGPVHCETEESEKEKHSISDGPSNAQLIKKLDEAEEVVLAPELLSGLETKNFFDALDNDDFEPLRKKPKLCQEDENPHKTIVMHVPQFIRCNKGGQSIQVQ